MHKFKDPIRDKLNLAIDEDSSVPVKVQHNLLLLLEENNGGLTVEQLMNLYEDKFGYDIDILSYGYMSMNNFINKLPKIFRRVTTTYNYEKLFNAQQQESELEKRFRLSKHPFEVISNKVKENIAKLFEDSSEIPLEQFPKLYCETYGSFIDPLTFGYADMEEFLTLFIAKLFNLEVKNNIKYLVKLPWDALEERESMAEIFLIQKHMKPSDFPDDCITPNDFLPLMDWSGEIIVGKTLDIIVSEIILLQNGLPLISFHLFKNRYFLENLETRMNDFYSDCPDEFLLPSVVCVSGVFCVSEYRHGGYNRAQIISKLLNQAVTVFFIDYGECAIVKTSKLRYLRKDFAELPAQVATCCIENDSHFLWSKDALTNLKRLLWYGDGEKIEATVVKIIDESRLHRGFVAKIRWNGKDVIEELQAKNILRKKPGAPHPAIEVSVESSGDSNDASPLQPLNSNSTSVPECCINLPPVVELPPDHTTDHSAESNYLNDILPPPSGFGNQIAAMYYRNLLNPSVPPGFESVSMIPYACQEAKTDDIHSSIAATLVNNRLEIAEKISELPKKAPCQDDRLLQQPHKLNDDCLSEPVETSVPAPNGPIKTSGYSKKSEGFNSINPNQSLRLELNNSHNWNSGEEIMQVTITGKTLTKIMVNGRPYFLLEQVLQVLADVTVEEVDPSHDDHYEKLTIPIAQFPRDLATALVRDKLIPRYTSEITIIKVHELARLLYLLNDKCDVVSIAMDLMKIEIPTSD